MGDMPIIRNGNCGVHGTYFGAACPRCALAVAGVDPRDARIAELEADRLRLALALVYEMSARASRMKDPPSRADRRNAVDIAESLVEFTDEAERVLGRRK